MRVTSEGWENVTVALLRPIKLGYFLLVKRVESTSGFGWRFNFSATQNIRVDL